MTRRSNSMAKSYRKLKNCWKSSNWPFFTRYRPFCKKPNRNASPIISTVRQILQSYPTNLSEFSFNYYFPGAMSRASDVFYIFYYLQFDAMIDEISTWPDFNQYTEKLRRLRPNLIERGCQMFDPNPNHFNSLNHGDFWVNNIMIKYKTDGKVDEVGSNFENAIFIDFQDSCWASPTLDLHYILNTSLCESLRPDSFNELVGFYHEELSKTLSRLNYREHIPKQQEFLEQFNARYFYGNTFFCFYGRLPIPPMDIHSQRWDVAVHESGVAIILFVFTIFRSQAL